MSVSRDSGRGFNQGEPIADNRGGTIRVSESSMDGNPGYVWVWIKAPADINAGAYALDRGEEYAGEMIETQVHLPLAAARQLRDDLDQVMREHFLPDGEGGPA